MRHKDLSGEVLVKVLLYCFMDVEAISDKRLKKLSPRSEEKQAQTEL